MVSKHTISHIFHFLPTQLDLQVYFSTELDNKFPFAYILKVHSGKTYSNSSVSLYWCTLIKLLFRMSPDSSLFPKKLSVPDVFPSSSLVPSPVFCHSWLVFCFRFPILFGFLHLGLIFLFCLLSLWNWFFNNCYCCSGSSRSSWSERWPGV